jgi:hypothetical protein
VVVFNVGDVGVWHEKDPELYSMSNIYLFTAAAYLPSTLMIKEQRK